MGDIFRHIIKQVNIIFSRVLFVIKQQRKDISVRGKRAIFVKLYHLVISIFLLLPSLLVVIMIRLLRPLVLIRFGYLNTSRIGSTVMYTAIYLDERNAYKNRKKICDIFYYFYPICNYQMLRMWRRVLHVPHFPFLLRLIVRLNRCIPGYKKHVVPMEERQMDGIRGILYSHVDTTVFFTTEEENLGRSMLKEMGVLMDKPFVCLLARDSAYLNFTFPGDSFYYHNYRDVTIDNYYSMAQRLTEKGYFIIRMGAKVYKPFVSDNPMIIDYATKYRSDFLDIYLSAKCNFFVSSSSGLDEVAKLFKRPVIHTNYVPLGLIPIAEEVVPLFIPKKLWLKSENRFLTFREIFNSELALLSLTEEYEKLGIEAIENTPEEISALALEMDEKVRGVWNVTDEDEMLQECFRSIFRAYNPFSDVKTRIGREFLRQNQQLLQF